jgi:hypothetical protein
MAALADRLIFFVGLNTGFVSNGEPDDRYVDFYRSRSSEKLHCAIVGNVVVPGGYGSNDSTARISRSRAWAAVAEQITKQGTLPGIQLATAWAGYRGSRTFRSPDAAHTLRRARDLVKTFSRFDLDEILASFDEGASIALANRFKHIQIHAAHGYLLSLLVDDRIAADACYTRSRLGQLAEWCRARGAQTSIRISLRTGDAIFDANGHADFQAKMTALPFDFVDISSGFYNIDKQLIYPGRPDTLEARRSETFELASRFPHRQFILSGRALSVPEKQFPKNVHIGVCRDLIANPRVLREPENGCVNSGKCHYFSRGEGHVTCPRWVQTGGAPSDAGA